MNYPARPGPYSLVSGEPPIPSKCKDIGEYRPATRLGGAVGSGNRLLDPRKSATVLNGVPLTHTGQQLDAVWHARSSAGFSDRGVSMTVLWMYGPPTKMFVGPNGWRQDETPVELAVETTTPAVESASNRRL